MKKILIFGEVIFDYNIYIKEIGLSIEKEFKTPKFFQEKKIINYGGAARVFENINFLTKNKNFFLSSFQKKIKIKNIINLSKKNRDIIKYRFWKKKKKVYQVNNDQGRKMIDNIKMEKNLILFLNKNKNKIKKIVISDYCYGLINKKKFNIIKNFSKKYQIPIYYDCQIYSKNLIKNYINDIDYFFCNEDEFNLYCLDLNISKRKSLFDRAKSFKKLRNITNLIIKLGKRGSVMIDQKNFLIDGRIKYKSHVSVNSSGAGDFYLSKFVTLPDFVKGKKRLYMSNMWAFRNIKI